ncbi:MAG: DUF4157 domain-containing protein [Acidobacteriota bacterium]
MRTYAQNQKQNQQSDITSNIKFSKAPTLAVRPLLSSHPTIGNQVVLTTFPLPNQDSDIKPPTLTVSQPGHSFSQIPIHPPAAEAIQTKLTISEPKDKYEQEADRVAEQVMRMTDPVTAMYGRVSSRFQAPSIQRMESKSENIVPNPESGSLFQQINHLKIGGQPLNTEMRAFFEPRFGKDFSQVRLHASSEDAQVASDLRARAFTVGNHIVFGAGQYAPFSTEGQRLLAHELTHVIQQTGSRSEGGMPSGVQRAPLGTNGPSAFTSHPPIITPLSFPAANQLFLQRAEDNLRTDKTCSGAVALPVSETFPEFARGTVYSLPFHAAKGYTIKVKVTAEYEPRAGDTVPSYEEYFGVRVHQCCCLSDEIIRAQEIQAIGNGGPSTISFSFELPDKCTCSTEVGDDFVYYLRIRNSGNQGIPVKIFYSVN